MLKSALLSGAALMLAGCIGPTGQITAGPLGTPSLETSANDLANFTVADLQNADAIASQTDASGAPRDPKAHMCYPALIRFVQAQQAALNGNAGLTVSGAISSFELARVTVKGVQATLAAGLPDDLTMNCAPLVVDIQNDATGFLATLAKIGIKP